MKVYVGQANCPYCGYRLVIFPSDDGRVYDFDCDRCPMQFRFTTKESRTLDEAVQAFINHDWSKW